MKTSTFLESPYELFREMQQYVDWSELDSRNVRAASASLEPSFASLIDDFYQQIEHHPRARQVITDGPAQVDRLKGTLLQWLRELVAGDYDQAYVESRWRVGLKHVEIGLSHVYVNAAISRLRRGLLQALNTSWEGDRQSLASTTQSLMKLLDLDIALIEAAYHYEYTARLQRNERFATLGQLAGGIAHEMRNPLNVIRTSVYYLCNTQPISEEKRSQHLQRIERQVARADGVIAALSRFTKMSRPNVGPFEVRTCVNEVLEEIPLPPQITIDNSTVHPEVNVNADREQIKIVLENLIRNALDAMPQGGALQIQTDVVGGQVLVAFVDTGIGMTAEELSQAMEPLFTTKARGLGLGLAISRVILEQNNGSIQVESEPGQGSTFTVALPLT